MKLLKFFAVLAGMLKNAGNRLLTRAAQNASLLSVKTDSLRAATSAESRLFAGAALAAFALLTSCACVNGASSLSLGQVRRIYVDRMPGDLDQYLRTEIYKQFKDRVQVVLDRREADGVLVDPSSYNGKSKPAPIASSEAASVSLLDRSGKVILWTGAAGDRSSLFQHGGRALVARNLVHKLKHAMETAR